MNKRSLGALVALNLALLGSVVALALTPPQAAQAQVLQPRQYMMVAGRTRQRDNQDIVYIIELNSARIAALIYNGNNDQWEVPAVVEAAPDLQNR